MPSCTVMIMESSRSMSSRVRRAIPFALFCAAKQANSFFPVCLNICGTCSMCAASHMPWRQAWQQGIQRPLTW